jgi:hypothetical protein
MALAIISQLGKLPLVSAAQSFLVLGPTELITIFFCLAGLFYIASTWSDHCVYLFWLRKRFSELLHSNGCPMSPV